MSEGREDANWDTAQQTHREIQEEILHSRNLELFEDVEPLLPYGNVLDCVEQEMPVDPWDPADQKLRRRLPSSSDRSGVKSAVKEQRGHEIPEGAHEGFESVAKLLKAAGKSIGSGKRKKRERSPIESEDEAEEGTRTFHDPLHSSQSTGKSPTKKPRKAVSRPRKSKARKKAIAQIAQASAETEEQRQYRKEKEEKEAFNRSALDFFNTEGPVRHRSVSPLMTPPSSPLRQTPVMTHPPMSSNPGECMPRTQGTPIRTSKLTPRTAQAAGFSQVAAMDLSWEDEKEAMLSTPAALNQSVQRVRHIGLARPSITSNHAKSADAMPPPPIPVNRLSSPATNASSLPEASPFPIRRVRRRPQSFAMSSAEKPPALLNSVESPMLPPNRLRRRHATRDSSSPVVERSVRGRDQSRVPAERVGQFVRFMRISVKTIG